MRVRLPETVEQGWAQVPRAPVEQAARQLQPFPARLTRVRLPGLPEPRWAEIAQAQADLAALPHSHSGFLL